MLLDTDAMDVDYCVSVTSTTMQLRVLSAILEWHSGTVIAFASDTVTEARRANDDPAPGSGNIQPMLVLLWLTGGTIVLVLATMWMDGCEANVSARYKKNYHDQTLEASLRPK